MITYKDTNKRKFSELQPDVYIENLLSDIKKVIKKEKETSEIVNIPKKYRSNYMNKMEVMNILNKDISLNASREDIIGIYKIYCALRDDTKKIANKINNKILEFQKFLNIQLLKNENILNIMDLEIIDISYFSNENISSNENIPNLIYRIDFLTQKERNHFGKIFFEKNKKLFSVKKFVDNGTIILSDNFLIEFKRSVLEKMSNRYDDLITMIMEIMSFMIFLYKNLSKEMEVHFKKFQEEHDSLYRDFNIINSINDTLENDEKIKEIDFPKIRQIHVSLENFIRKARNFKEKIDNFTNLFPEMKKYTIIEDESEILELEQLQEKNKLKQFLDKIDTLMLYLLEKTQDRNILDPIQEKIKILKNNYENILSYKIIALFKNTELVFFEIVKIIKDLTNPIEIENKDSMMKKNELFQEYFKKFLLKIMEISKKMSELQKINESEKSNQKEEIILNFKELNNNFMEIYQYFNELNNIKNNIKNFNQKVIEEKIFLLKNLLEKCDIFKKELNKYNLLDFKTNSNVNNLNLYYFILINKNCEINHRIDGVKDKKILDTFFQIEKKFRTIKYIENLTPEKIDDQISLFNDLIEKYEELNTDIERESNKDLNN